MKWLLLCLATFACTASSNQQTYSLEDAEILFEKFIVDYNRQYADEQEKQMRFEIFKQTLIKVNALNDKQGAEQVFGITKFSDFAVDELNNLNGFVPTDYLCNTTKTDADIPDVDAPESWDWRDKGVVSEVKYQGIWCSSCYAFSALGNLEGQYAIKHKHLLSLSVQQIVDCSAPKYGTYACGGGVMSGVFRYAIEQGGIEKESDYSYTGIWGDCSSDKSKVAVKVTDCIDYNLKSQNKLKQLLYQTGPISIALDADYLFYYVKKVLKDCRPMKINHAVLLVGYGTDPVEGDYWLFKNSWGKDFGENGYFRIERGEGKLSCGIVSNNFTSSAIVE